MPGRKDARTTEKPLQQHIKLRVLEWVFSNRLAITLLLLGHGGKLTLLSLIEQFFKEPIESFTLDLNADLLSSNIYATLGVKSFFFK